VSPSAWPWTVVIGYCTIVVWIDSPGFLDDTFQSEIRQWCDMLQTLVRGLTNMASTFPPVSVGRISL